MSNALEIDLYQARMLIGYYENGMQNIQGVMEAFGRKLPNSRKFFVVAGIDRILGYLNQLRITKDDIVILQEVLPEVKFTPELVQYLMDLDFSELQVFSMREGEIAFANQPFVQVTGPIGMIQFVETKILSILNHDIRVASKAARVVIAAQGRPVLEFGSRRTHDGCAPDAARAAFIAGCSGTSNVKANALYGIPASGTMGHVWIMSHVDGGEIEAFENWNKTFPNSVYLIDTYDAAKGVENALAANSHNGGIGAIRLDSGDLLTQSIRFRAALNNQGYSGTKIIASDDLNEYKITKMISDFAQIDAFGVGTEIVSTPDAPTCGLIYKLVAITDKDNKWHNVAKIASGDKGTYPGAKQVFRYIDKQTNDFTHDVIGLDSEVMSPGFAIGLSVPQELLVQQDVKGWVAGRNAAKERVDIAKEYCQKTLNQMPEYLKIITQDTEHASRYPVEFSKALTQARADFISNFSG